MKPVHGLFILALATLAFFTYPIKVAYSQEIKPDETQFIDYQQFHKSVQKKTTLNRAVVTKAYNGKTYTKEEVQELIKNFSAQYGIDSSTPLCIASKESGFNQFSKNPNSTASGVFQYLISTWNQTDEGKAGLSVWDANANVRAAVKYMAVHRNTRPWVVAPSCPTLEFL